MYYHNVGHSIPAMELGLSLLSQHRESALPNRHSKLHFQNILYVQNNVDYYVSRTAATLLVNHIYGMYGTAW